MSDLISRSALYDKLIYDTTKTATVTGGEYIATWRIADVIDEAPTIDAVPVVHGRWIPTYHKYYNRDGECLIADEWHCSECGVRHRDKWNYCPNCGAKMDGEADV